MKKTMRILALSLALAVALGVCGAAQAYDIYPNYDRLLEYYNGNAEAAAQAYDKYMQDYITYMREHGDPTNSSKNMTDYTKYLEDKKYTPLEGYTYNEPNCYYPYYGGTPYYGGNPNYYGGGYAPAAQSAPYVSVNRAPQEEYEIKFMTGESKASGNRLVFKTKTLDATEITRNRIYITSASLVTSGGESFSWTFVSSGEAVSDAGKIARLDVIFGKSAQATLTVHESNGTVDKQVNCSQRSLSVVGGNATVLGVIAYDINGNIITAYDASGAECDPSALGAQG